MSNQNPNAPKVKKEKISFPELDSVYKESLEKKTDEELRAECTQASFDEQQNQELKKADKHLKEVQETARQAGETYALGTKRNKQRIGYTLWLLDSRNKVKRAGG